MAAGFTPYVFNRPGANPEEDLQDDISNLAYRLSAIGQPLPEEPKQNGLLDTLLKVLNVPGAAIRSGLMEAAAPEDNNFWDNIWNNQSAASGQKLLERFGVSPESDIGKGVAGFAAEVATDPLTFLSGGLLRGGLKIGLPLASKPLATIGTRALLEAPYKALTGAVGATLPKIPGLRKLPEAIDDVKTVFGLNKSPARKLLQEQEALLKRRVGMGEEKFMQTIGEATSGLQEPEFAQVLDLLEDPAERAMHGLSHTRPTLPKDLEPGELLSVQEALAKRLKVPATDIPQIAATKQIPGRQISKAVAEDLEDFRVAYDNARRVTELQTKYDGVVRGGLIGSKTAAPHVLKAVQGLEGVFGDVAKQEGSREILQSLQDYYVTHTKNVQPATQAGALASAFTRADPNAQMRKHLGTVSQLEQDWVQQGGAPFFVQDPFIVGGVRAMRGVRATETFDFMKRILDNGQFSSTLKDAKTAAKQAGMKVEDWMKARNLVEWKPPSQYVAGLFKQFGDTTYLLDAEMAEGLTKVVKAYSSDESINTFVKMIDSGTNTWKKLVTLYNPAFHLNNMIGNLWNMFLGGFKNPARFLDASEVMAGKQTYSMAVNLGTGAKRALNGGELFDLAREKGVLTSGFFESLDQTAEGLLGRAEAYKAKFQAQGFRQKASNVVHKAGAYAENNSRMAMWLDGLGKGMTPDEATKWVNTYLFDYSASGSEFEKQVMRRIFPFWAWTRNNVPLQLTEITKQPAKFLGYKRTREAMETAFPLTEEEKANRPEYLKESVPLFGLRGSDINEAFGNDPLLFNPRLPLQDLNRLIPQTSITSGGAPAGRELMGSVHPALKLAYELPYNVDMFQGTKIERYPGQTVPIQTPFGETRIGAKPVHAAEQFGGIALRAPSAIMRALSEERDTTDILRAVRIVIPGMYTFDESKVRVQKLRDERQRLQDAITKIKSEGGRVPTVTELGGRR